MYACVCGGGGGPHLYMAAMTMEKSQKADTMVRPACESGSRAPPVCEQNTDNNPAKLEVRGSFILNDFKW